MKQTILTLGILLSATYSLYAQSDSGASLNRTIQSVPVESGPSLPNNPAAVNVYNKGVVLMDSGDYAEAIPYFKKAVEIDSQFVFAWDDLGTSYRHTKDDEHALYAYHQSLILDPKGRAPLDNIPVIYESQQKYDAALKAYQDILHLYPNDAEAYYGSGRIYTYFKNDLEKGLDNICKACNLYMQMNSPYSTDAENTIGYIYSEMKKAGKEDAFNKILKENNIGTTN